MSHKEPQHLTVNEICYWLKSRKVLLEMRAEHLLLPESQTLNAQEIQRIDQLHAAVAEAAEAMCARALSDSLEHRAEDEPHLAADLQSADRKIPRKDHE